MDVHNNARLTPQGRALFVRRACSEDWRVKHAAAAVGISPRTAFRWLARHRAGGEFVLQDRSSAPARYPHRNPRRYPHPYRTSPPSARDPDRRSLGNSACHAPPSAPSRAASASASSAPSSPGPTSSDTSATLPSS
ncbi:MAG: helix-turn-helix domain-containing protein [Acidisphaera sp.]|nr:helix-turn-helix domain-containing protein [Acidisphaera sp.]